MVLLATCVENKQYIFIHKILPIDNIKTNPLPFMFLEEGSEIQL